jgi:hypothetical protein
VFSKEREGARGHGASIRELRLREGFEVERVAYEGEERQGQSACELADEEFSACCSYDKSAESAWSREMIATF